jgi:hypothetical protein
VLASFVAAHQALNSMCNSETPKTPNPVAPHLLLLLLLLLCCCLLLLQLLLDEARLSQLLKGNGGHISLRGERGVGGRHEGSSRQQQAVSTPPCRTMQHHDESSGQGHVAHSDAAQRHQVC